jgi:hypothetical protein
VTSGLVRPLSKTLLAVLSALAFACGGGSSNKDAGQPGGGGGDPFGGGGIFQGNGGFTPGQGGAAGGTGQTNTATSTSTSPGSGGSVPGSGGIAAGSGGVVAGTGGVPGTGGSSSTCGEPGFACCTGNACKGGGCCVSGICMAEGGACVGLGGGVCSAGACGTCGGPGLPCCGTDAKTGSCTAPSTLCSGGTCAKCGELGATCCVGPAGSSTGVCNDVHAICGASNICTPCGTPGSPCCPGSQCDGAGCCFNNTCVAEGTDCGASAGTCQAKRCSGCGAASQACCPSNTCYDGLLCKGSMCTSCGDTGQACCAASSAAGQCKAGLACSSSGSDGVCARCGGAGDICCAGNTCADGCCSGGRCLASTSCSADAAAPGDTAPPDNCATGGAPCSALAHFTGTQNLDGKDDEFCSIPSFELNFTNVGANGKIIENNGTGRSYAERAVARVAWDAAGLHAFIRVYDTTFKAAASTELWNGDSVELFFSSSTSVTGLTYDDKNTLHVIVSPPIAQISRDTNSSGSQTSLPTSQFVTGTDSTGYFVELNLPWPGTAPAASAQIKFDMQLNVADGATASSDLYVRDAQAVLYLGSYSSTTTSCSSSAVQPFCDDRLWCTTTLQP